MFYFDFDSYTLRPDAIEAVNAHIAALQGNDRTVRLEGHTDERGTRSYLFCSDATEVGDWYAAEARCQEFGYELTIIEDAAENAWVDSTGSAVAGNIGWWIGLHDNDTEGTYVWQPSGAVDPRPRRVVGAGTFGDRRDARRRTQHRSRSARPRTAATSTVPAEPPMRRAPSAPIYSTGSRASA